MSGIVADCLVLRKCMREDTQLLTRLARIRVEENYLRCCSLNDGSKTCGMVLQEDCERCCTN